jgi:hypothetical protein
MLIKGILPVISPERQKCGFAFPYKSTTYVIDLIRGILQLYPSAA